MKNNLIFQKILKKISNNLKNRKNIIGYGAGQMVPSFAYHLKVIYPFWITILDDNKKGIILDILI